MYRAATAQQVMYCGAAVRNREPVDEAFFFLSGRAIIARSAHGTHALSREPHSQKQIFAVKS
jgi:hypothetical protein